MKGMISSIAGAQILRKGSEGERVLPGGGVRLICSPGNLLKTGEGTNTGVISILGFLPPVSRFVCLNANKPTLGKFTNWNWVKHGIDE
jgi:hypothetical protein